MIVFVALTKKQSGLQLPVGMLAHWNKLLIVQATRGFFWWWHDLSCLEKKDMHQRVAPLLSRTLFVGAFVFLLSLLYVTQWVSLFSCLAFDFVCCHLLWVLLWIAFVVVIRSAADSLCFRFWSLLSQPPVDLSRLVHSFWVMVQGRLVRLVWRFIWLFVCRWFFPFGPVWASVKRFLSFWPPTFSLASASRACFWSVGRCFLWMGCFRLILHSSCFFALNLWVHSILFVSFEHVAAVSLFLSCRFLSFVPRRPVDLFELVGSFLGYAACLIRFIVLNW